MDPFEVIGAFVDGERVDPETLKNALSSDEGRQYLVDVALLRELTVGEAPLSGHRDLGAPVNRDVAISGHRRGMSAQQRWLAPVAAAAVLVMALTGGYVIGRRTVVTDPARSTSLTATQPAPAPTSVIKLEPGVDWHEQTVRN